MKNQLYQAIIMTYQNDGDSIKVSSVTETCPAAPTLTVLEIKN